MKTTNWYFCIKYSHENQSEISSIKNPKRYSYITVKAGNTSKAIQMAIKTLLKHNINDVSSLTIKEKYSYPVNKKLRIRYLDYRSNCYGRRKPIKPMDFLV